MNTDQLLPFIGQYDQVRTSPLQAAATQAVAANAGANASGAGKGGAPVMSTGAPLPSPQAPSPQDIAQAQVAAASGDPNAIDWLKTLGLIGGVAGAGALGAALLARQTQKTSTTAKDITGSVRTNTPATPVATRTPPGPGTQTGKDVAIPVTQLKDEQIVPRAGGYIQDMRPALPNPDAVRAVENAGRAAIRVIK